MTRGPLVIGIDAGGTSSRASVHDLRGNRLGIGRSGGGNPHSHPPEDAAAAIGEAAREALAPVEPSMVRAGVLGLAGSSKLTERPVRELFQRAWESAGLRCPMRVVTDPEVAFAAGTPAASGTVLIAGTGAVAARVDDHRLYGTVGGYGWLLGDEGSAFWLGREAVRATLESSEGRRRWAGVCDTVVSTLLGPDRAGTDPGALRRELIAAVNAAPPVRLADLAPVVTSAASDDAAGADGDEVAEDILRRGVRLLTDTARAAHRPAGGGPVVLSGALLDADTPLGRGVRRDLGNAGLRVVSAGAGTPGAAWLAALELLAPDAAAGRHPEFQPARGRAPGMLGSRRPGSEGPGIRGSW